MSARKSDLNAMFGDASRKIKFSAESYEEEDEKRLRLRKEWWGFIIKELVPYLLAFVMLSVAFVVSIAIIADPARSPSQVDRAWGVVVALVGSIAGFVFGKAAAK